MSQETITETVEGLESSREDGALQNGVLWAYSEREVITWSETVKKEARSLDGHELGQVRHVGRNYVHVVRGIFKKEKFLIPRDLAHGFDGSTLWFCLEHGTEFDFLTPKR